MIELTIALCENYWRICHAREPVGADREGAIMLGRRGGPFVSPRNGAGQYVHVSVDDVDRHLERARQYGAKILAPPSDKPFGERQYTAEDHEIGRAHV